MVEEWTVDTAHITHGRDGFQVHVERVSLWRLAASKASMEVLHALRLCCANRWVVYAPQSVVRWLMGLENRLLGIDNGWHHIQYHFDVDDDWARTHAPELWATMARSADDT